MTHEPLRESPEGRKLLAALRDACRQLPEVEDMVDGFGHTTFKVRGKSFVIAGMGETGRAVAIKSDRVTQSILIRQGPWYRTPYIGQHGWVSIDDPLENDWAAVREMIVDGYRRAAPKRLVAMLPPE